MRPLLTLLALALAGCINPMEGDFGPVKVVPEQDSCKVTMEEHDLEGVRVRVYSKRACKGYDLEVFGRRL